MKNLKFIAGFSIFGFLLSIFSSLKNVSRSFGGRFFIALCFALGFGILAAAIMFVTQKFVLAENTADISDSGNSSGKNPHNSVSGSQPVDIVVQDEDLPSEDGGSQFYVGENHQMLNDEDLQDMKKVSEPEETEDSGSSELRQKKEAENISETVAQIKKENSSSVNAGFVPLNFSENPSNISSVESKSVNDVKTVKSSPESDDSSASGENNPEALDVLPDLEALSEAVPAAGSGSSGFSENSDFSENKNTVSASSGDSSTEKSSGQDAELMAKAISTLLSKDK